MGYDLGKVLDDSTKPSLYAQIRENDSRSPNTWSISSSGTPLVSGYTSKNEVSDYVNMGVSG